ncbi:MAG: type II toxin-antitoxin system YafQ family toxin [Dehalococcoidia bacterium]|nr:type II toxin-antitoxin system YafQ family toxin [Dehalococcoidia bacterium]
MRELILSTKYRRELRRAARRGKDREKIKEVTDKLVAGEPLEPRYHPHRLVGDMAGYWECRIEPDWLLVWEEDETKVTLLRTGSHADIFGL